VGPAGRVGKRRRGREPVTHSAVPGRVDFYLHDASFDDDTWADFAELVEANKVYGAAVGASASIRRGSVRRGRRSDGSACIPPGDP
jgi:hypothetical protein